MPAYIHTEADLERAIAALVAADPRWAAVLERGGKPPLRRREGGFAGLAQIIVSQQVSVASAAAIHGRLVAIGDPFDHTSVLRARKRQARARRPVEREDQDAEGDRQGDRRPARSIFMSLADMPADDAHAALIALHGIGPWTADIYLLTCIGHADAWPAGDLALQEAARVAFGLRKRPTTKDMGPLAERWRPYRAVAARLLWTYYRAVKKREGLLSQPPAPKPKKKKAKQEWPVRSTARGLRQRAARRASSSCSCTAMAPTATT